MEKKNIELILEHINEINERKSKVGDRGYLSTEIIKTINNELHTSPFFCIEKLNSEEVKRAIEHINCGYSCERNEESLDKYDYVECFFDGLEMLRLEREAEQSQYGE